MIRRNWNIYPSINKWENTEQTFMGKEFQINRKRPRVGGGVMKEFVNIHNLGVSREFYLENIRPLSSQSNFQMWQTAHSMGRGEGLLWPCSWVDGRRISILLLGSRPEIKYSAEVIAASLPLRNDHY
ncbi:hypothetical protein CDAR_237961 [Caerostris darwini]|uniref:Uncharacterized protein n=1 Tax=Caerostris darwini TaxID=1538125 RepID=A0AAV4S181_9ARAC|nr:hypothetical protein CDAR_237961 [Caerostris darwini]